MGIQDKYQDHSNFADGMNIPSHVLCCVRKDTKLEQNQSLYFILTSGISSLFQRNRKLFLWKTPWIMLIHIHNKTCNIMI
ncbi:hypothetical protein XENTR_v10014631 [Xenopus tropicalis]|nr:hypothetical protein XENTR_v10014631 [Xenopus tropicalis]